MPHYNRHSAITGKQQVHWLEFGLELVFPVSHHESITGLSVTGLSLTSTSKISSSSDSFSTQSQNFMKIHPKFFALSRSQINSRENRTLQRVVEVICVLLLH